MKFCTNSEIDFAIQILKLNADKIPNDSYAKTKVVVMTNHVIFELEELKKNV